MPLRGSILRSFSGLALRTLPYASHSIVPHLSSFARHSTLAASSRILRIGEKPTIATRRLTSIAAKRPEDSNAYTAGFALFEVLWEAGIKVCFVNVGSDHPSILEAIAWGKRERPESWPRIITCPTEITAISMADGYARITGQPQAVLVHVDVGTQALGQGVHNACIGRVPVLLLAGLCPYTESGELPGSRGEYQQWLQEAPDQFAIVRQYCRYAGEIRSSVNIKQMVGRALQFAGSAPKGPTYLAAPREVLAQPITPYALDQDHWKPIGPGALPDNAIRDIATALAKAERPLIITGYSGRDKRTPEVLVGLADLIPGIRVYNTSGSDVCFPFSHIASEGFSLSTGDCVPEADAILILDCDVPWIPSQNPPHRDCRIFHVDCDPLNQQIPVSFFQAHGRWKADSFTALTQLVDYMRDDQALSSILQSPQSQARREQRRQIHKARIDKIVSKARVGDDEILDLENIGRILKTDLSDVATTAFVMEAITAAPTLFDQIQPSRPGSWINCGGTGIGWSNGAALGVKMALDDTKQSSETPIVCQVVGDGSFLCAAPSSAIWVARKYEIPVLTVVLNNGGWKSPRRSAKLMYPEGLAASATDDELNMSFRPSPDYVGIAKAASGSVSSGKEDEVWMEGTQVRTVRELRQALKTSVRRLEKDKKAMFIEVLL